MPDRDVKTIRDQIFFQYAKIIGRRAFGPNAKKVAYGFIKTKFRELRDDEQQWSDIIRNDKQLVEGEKKCVYCGATENLQWEHIVAKSLMINERCPTCPRIQEIHNLVWACRTCNASKSDKGLYHFIRDTYTGDGKYYDNVPILAEEKYLKTIYYCHECKGTLNKQIEGITPIDLDL